MTIQQILDAAIRLDEEIEATPAGAPELAAIIATLTELRAALERTRSVQGPLVPDSSSPRTADEVSGVALAETLDSLLEAAAAKR